VNEERFWPIIMVVIYGGLIPILYLPYAFPYRRPIQMASHPDGVLVAPPSYPEDPEGIRETNHVWILYKIAAVMWFLVLTPFVYMAITGARFDFKPLPAVGISIVAHLFFAWLLGRITVEVDQTGIKASMGPIKSKTAIEDIGSIRACTVRPLRDFFGWGLRIKADGSRGFIADMNVGLEFIRKDSRRTVVTVREPQQYVDFVRWAKANKRMESNG
jgi:hypothetical protein